jgi:hypothetical protein
MGAVSLGCCRSGLAGPTRQTPAFAARELESEPKSNRRFCKMRYPVGAEVGDQIEGGRVIDEAQVLRPDKHAVRDIDVRTGAIDKRCRVPVEASGLFTGANVNPPDSA